MTHPEEGRQDDAPSLVLSILGAMREEGRQTGLREAAEIARAVMRQVGTPPFMTLRQVSLHTGHAIAEAIESKLAELEANKA